MDNKIKLFNEWIKNNFNNCWNIPGLAICVFDDKTILYKKSFLSLKKEPVKLYNFDDYTGDL